MAQYGNLEVAARYITEDGFRLGQWLDNQRTRKKRNADSRKTDEELAQLDELGMRWETKPDIIWENNYQQAKRFYETNNHLNPSCNHTVGRFNLGKWIGRQRELYRAGRLNIDQIQRLEAIGMEWISPNSWGRYYKIAEQYYRVHKNLEIQPDYISSEGFLLGRWIAGQRLAKKQGTMSPKHIQKLNSLSMRWINKNDERWDRMLLDLTDWITDHTDTPSITADNKEKAEEIEKQVDAALAARIN